MLVVIFNENIPNKDYRFSTLMSFWTLKVIDKLQNMVEVFLSCVVVRGVAANTLFPCSRLANVPLIW